MDIFEALLESHERQRAICRRLLTAIGEPGPRRQALDDLKAEMAAHETAEERTFYVPLIEHDETVDAARHGIAEHHEMDEMVEDLDKADAGSPGWLEAIGKLVQKVEHHLQEEEQKFFPQAREVLSRREQKALGEPYREEHERLAAKEEEGQEREH
ncbi:hemerythrin domain-containing protein [Ramlibacter tataouinensis]|uniref:hemerythrin domain-containing protein n=1 Tax=Ramlibacter tataouinensis TaxID=94132 RepID=UPI0022F3B766|nr:hemerythrin domain-containing protein [Ramlibacter tataouinensis]WBY00696.1 hemerythrin domain-containing protein [Ramlibacter tataouinensis]